jgi:hypothetical protein
MNDCPAFVELLESRLGKTVRGEEAIPRFYLGVGPARVIRESAMLGNAPNYVPIVINHSVVGASVYGLY